MAGKKPSKGTPADKRLKANKAKAASPAPKFGSAAWDARYGIKRGSGKRSK